MKICPVVAVLIRAVRQTRQSLKALFAIHVNVPKSYSTKFHYSASFQAVTAVQLRSAVFWGTALQTVVLY